MIIFYKDINIVDFILYKLIFSLKYLMKVYKF
jgi:hypothetical protein